MFYFCVRNTIKAEDSCLNTAFYNYRNRLFLAVYSSSSCWHNDNIVGPRTEEQIRSCGGLVAWMWCLAIEDSDEKSKTTQGATFFPACLTHNIYTHWAIYMWLRNPCCICAVSNCYSWLIQLEICMAVQLIANRWWSCALHKIQFAMLQLGSMDVLNVARYPLPPLLQKMASLTAITECNTESPFSMWGLISRTHRTISSDSLANASPFSSPSNLSACCISTSTFLPHLAPENNSPEPPGHR